ncbi:MAG TPA: 16S rRNA pseudouridine(516) synthase RsuA [Arsenophonus nasoniae]|uniref:Pseudouridine synthase n=1 Tax=Arsenophonus nasoniae TaxID=638 RepID=A0AA95K9E0_9GAMM|nr:16S rRNA pseudouridine(516) synthase RsuA [Arsenophonus nasoniae]WGL96902.1 16S rRNA pseudouridine(516) synthase RsuA [Arsenophonus nasoniae]
MRLDKFLSQQLTISRGLVMRELRAGKVMVDNEIIKTGSYQITPEMIVSYDGVVLQHIIGPRYFMLNKPQGYVCSTVDSVNLTILSFIDEPAITKLHIAGRLDIDTTGLVIITDDGKWTHKMISPKHHCEKTYLVTLAQPVSTELADKFLAGIWLKGEKLPTKPAKLSIVSLKQVRLTISEGRYHQVKRMFAAVGNHVCALHRERIGGIYLDPALRAGEYRSLTQEEIKTI